MDPLVCREGGSAAHFERIARPHVVQPCCQLAFFEQQFIAAATCVHPGAALVQHNVSRSRGGGLEPKAEREGIGAGEMCEAGKGEPVLAVEQGSLARFACDEFEIVVYPAGL